MKRRCLHPGCSALTDAARCPEHRAALRAKYAGPWRSIAKAAVRAHIALHGSWCPGWRSDPPHQADDLTLDHDGIVLCRAHNTAKRNYGDG